MDTDRLAGRSTGCRRRGRHAAAGALAALVMALGTAAHGTADTPENAAPTWQLAGRLGLAQYVVVPEASAQDRAYYDRIVSELCPGDRTCFLRFFTNTDGAAVGLPLPDEIQHQPTVMFQRSAKYGREMFQWSCRLQVPGEDCF